MVADIVARATKSENDIAENDCEKVNDEAVA